MDRWCPKSRRKYDTYIKGMDYLFYYTNFVNVSRKLLEIDIIKYLLLDYDQIRLFQFINRPFINVDQKSKEYVFHHVFEEIAKTHLKTKSDINAMSEKDKQEVRLIYKQLVGKQNKSAIEERMVKTISTNFAELSGNSMNDGGILTNNYVGV